MFGFVTYDISFVLLNLNAVEYFHNAYERAYYFQLAQVGLSHWYFAGILLSCEYHVSKILRFSALVCRLLWQPVIQLIGCCEMWDLSVGNLGTELLCKTMCPPAYYHNDFVATHALGSMIYGYTLVVPVNVPVSIYLACLLYLYLYIYISLCIYIHMYIYIYIARIYCYCTRETKLFS